MNNLSILIGGTSSSYLEVSKRMLQFHYSNCEVEFAYSGEECINRALENGYDLILFDYQLGDMNGLEVVESLREKDIKTPLVVLIDEGEDEIALKAVDKGASDYIFKVRGYLTALPITIRNILERKNLIETSTSVIPKLETTELQNGDKGYFILDRRGRILSANHNMEEITNYSEDELLELNLLDLLPKESEKSFFEWLNLISDNGNSRQTFKTEILGKTGDKICIDISLTAIRDEHQRVVSYRGTVENIAEETYKDQAAKDEIDQLEMVNKISEVITTSHQEPLNIFLEKIAELACEVFGFQRATLALLDKRKKAFVKQAMIGYRSVPILNGRNIEVPQEVINRIFANRFRVKVIYYNQEQRDTSRYLNASFPERRTQKRRPQRQWHKRDLILVNLMNRHGSTFGYISLDIPVDYKAPSRETFRNFELFGQLVSMSIENFYQFSTLEKRSRRLKQILVTSNIFKLYLSLNELLKEIVWSIKFSLDFNLVVLGLISKKSGNLELKAVACDDKIKVNRLQELAFPLKPLAALLRSEYSRGKSYLVVKEEEVLRSFKQIYYGPSLRRASNGTWPSWGVLLVPIKSREDKVIGILMVDDPDNNRLPSNDTIHTLEILANQIAVAIDNRILYIQAKNRIQELEKEVRSSQEDIAMPKQDTPGIRRWVDRIFN
ncbi:response regulator [candidate division KSB1 bacterium]|nr:response regulator [candidate division KSB1 bacterium]NIR69840.1 response regulator [candidate division KSB1 bacterium]NIS24387.1 response regulator [candidate division KSB1 bacterium]NIT71323.1 response regulator [candidate division KSB1 bacterium]NIU27618.1 response regulator [candidate division KSB1 bacterium]